MEAGETHLGSHKILGDLWEYLVTWRLGNPYLAAGCNRPGSEAGAKLRETLRGTVPKASLGGLG